ncbi:MAG: hypothetical protein ACOX9B_14390 [Candidatus Xenobium sp.]|jgi:hypothetical protein
MQIGSASNIVRDAGSSLDVTRTKARELTQQMVADQQQKIGASQGASAAAGTATRDVSALSEEAVQAVVPTQQQQGADVDSMVTALRDYVNGKLGSPDQAQKAKGADGDDKQSKKKKKSKFEIEFQPHIQANTIQAPGDSIGEFKVNKKDVEEVAAPGKSRSSASASGQQADGAQGAGASAGGTGGAASAGGVGGASAAPVDQTDLSQEAQGLEDKPAQGAQGESTHEDGKEREIQMSAGAAEAMKSQMQGGKGPQTQGAGMIVDSGGSAAVIPQDGGTLRTNNWEQSVWVHPGGSLEQTGGLIERYRKLDDSPSHIWFDKRGQNTEQVARQFQEEAAEKPQASDSADKTKEIQKLRNPGEDAQD